MTMMPAYQAERVKSKVRHGLGVVMGERQTRDTLFEDLPRNHTGSISYISVPNILFAFLPFPDIGVTLLLCLIRKVMCAGECSCGDGNSDYQFPCSDANTLVVV